jgi:DNA-directed RNA polymerase specialized sigma24 family protein
MMLAAKQVANQQTASRATGADFCRIFMKDMDRLYTLAYLLSADRETAEQCFVSGLENSAKGNPVFKEWAESWARRTIIQNAILRLQPIESRTTDGSDANSEASSERPEFAAIVGLPAFERFVFVMSVLEGYSDQDCSLLLGCARAQVAQAKIRALAKIGSSARLRRMPLTVGSGADELTELGEGSRLSAPLAASA